MNDGLGSMAALRRQASVPRREAPTVGKPSSNLYYRMETTGATP